MYLDKNVKTACRNRACTRIVESDFCQKHRPKDDRPSASRRGYDSKWRRFRNRYLEIQPACEDPYGRHGEYPPEATTVDHIVPLKQGGPRFDPRNAQSLCRGCHAKKTRADREGTGGRGDGV